MKKIVSILIALMMMLVLGVVAFADGGTVEVGTLEDLQNAISNVQNGDTIVFTANITGNVTLNEAVGLYYTIDGNNKEMTGTITINPLSDTKDNRRITIKNINFIDPAPTENNDFINAVKTNHYPRITIEGCSFAGSKDASDVAIRLKGSYGAIIKNCTGTGLFLFLHNTAGNNLTIENVTVTDNPTEGGFSLGTVEGVTIKDCAVVTEGYGIRLDTGYDNKAVIEDCDVDAFIPVVVRNATVATTIELRGENEMTASNDDGIWFAAGKTEYKKGNTTLESPSAAVTLKINDEGLKEKQDDIVGVNKETVTSDAARIGNNYYATLQAAIDAIRSGSVSGEIVLLESVSGSFDIEDGENITIDLNENTLTLNPAIGSTGTETSGSRVLYGGKLTIKNGTIECGTESSVSGKTLKVGIANYGELTLEDVTFNASETVRYTINNRGILNLKGKTTVNENKNPANGAADATGKVWAITNDPYNYVPEGTTVNAELNVAKEDKEVVVGPVQVEQYARNGNSGAKIELNISAGTFAEITSDGAASVEIPGNISGGTFSKLPDKEYLKDGAVIIVDGKEYEKKGDELIEHKDEDKDHDCDCGCDKEFGEHKDENKDHDCDYGCEEKIGDCVFGEWVVIRRPGCEINGIKRRSCKYGCGESEERSIKASHDYEDGVCERCGKVSGIDYIDGVIGPEKEENESNPNTGAPVMIPAAAVLAALSGIVVFKRK